MSQPQSDKVDITEMAQGDIAKVIQLWQQSDGVTCNDHDDTEKGVLRFLRRNPEYCLVAKSDGDLVGCVLCGNDGRRAYIYHMAVASSHRRLGIARKMMDILFERLRQAKIRTSHLFVLNANTDAQKFWQSCGYEKPERYMVMTKRLF